MGKPAPQMPHEGLRELDKAQRDAAWGEVARRLAHEIKNPLTPIQLSAERLRRKYLDKLPSDDAKVRDRATHTIVQQVEAMKTMVNDFSEYAKPAKLQIKPLAVDAFLAEVTAHAGHHDGQLHLLGLTERTGLGTGRQPEPHRRVLYPQ